MYKLTFAPALFWTYWSVTRIADQCSELRSCTINISHEAKTKVNETIISLHHYSSIQKLWGNSMEEGRGLFIEISDQYENFAFKHDVGWSAFFLQVEFFCNCGTFTAFPRNENHLNLQLADIWLLKFWMYL